MLTTVLICSVLAPGGEKEFEFPRFDPCPDGVEDIKPVPYRPFRWGDFQYVLHFSQSVVY